MRMAHALAIIQSPSENRRERPAVGRSAGSDILGDRGFGDRFLVKRWSTGRFANSLV